MAAPLETPLPGCRPQPVASYLKALAILRIVSAYAPGTRGAWRDGEGFVLFGSLTPGDLLDYFVADYSPTPVVSPWNGGSGFYPKDRHDALEEIAASTGGRLAPYRETIASARRALTDLHLDSKPDPKEGKPALLARCRATFPDAALPWLDACAVLAGDGPTFMPLLGTGGNDGRLDFSNNHMQQLVRCLRPGPATRANLEQALFGGTTGALQYTDATLGQFSPGAVGGPGASAGVWEGAPSVNPWDYVLTMEGAVAFAGSVARRLSATAGRGKAAFPFTVRTSAVGPTAIAEADGADERTRAEIWLPLWSRPATWAEVAFLLAEGRADLNTRQARTGVEFAVAAVSLGVDRGIDAFERTALLRRNGLSFIATSLGRVRVGPFEGSDLLRDPPLVEWTQRFQAAAGSKGAPASWAAAWRRLESALLACALGYGAPQGFQDVLIALAAAEHVVAQSKNHRDVPPCRSLNARWSGACAGGGTGTEWVVAEAVAGIGPARGAPHIREYLEPVVALGNGRWHWSPASKRSVWNSDRPTPRNLQAVLARIRLDAGTGGSASLPLAAGHPADISDVHEFLCGRLDEPRLGALVLGAAMTERPSAARSPRSYLPRPPDLPRAYAILKQVFSPGELAPGVRVLPNPAILKRLESAEIDEATGLALQQLRGSRLPVRMAAGQGGWVCSGTTAERMAGALLIPLADERTLRALVFRDRTDSGSSGSDER